MTTLNNLYRQFIAQPATQKVPTYIVGAQCNPNYPEVKAIAEAHYYQIWIEEVYLRDNVRWFSTWYPAVHCNTRTAFGGSSIDKTYVYGPSSIDGKPLTAAGKIIRGAVEIVPMTPFRGNSLTLTIGLFGLQGGSYVQSFLSALTTMSSLAAQPQFSAALAMADPIVNTLDSIITATQGGLQTAYEGTFTDGTLRTMYIPILENRISDPNRKLFVDNGILKAGESFETAKQFTGEAYLLAKIALLEGRTDWSSFKIIETPFKKAIASKMTGGSDDEAKSFLKTAILNAFDCAALTNKDRNRIISIMKKEFEETQNALGYSRIDSERHDYLTDTFKRQKNSTVPEYKSLTDALQFTE